MDQHVTRRSVTRSIIGGAIGGLAGCSTLLDQTDTSTSADSSTSTDSSSQQMTETTIRSSIIAKHVEEASIQTESSAEIETEIAAEIGIAAVDIDTEAGIIDFFINATTGIRQRTGDGDGNNTENGEDIPHFADQRIASVCQEFGVNISPADIHDGLRTQPLDRIRSTIESRIKALNIDPTTRKLEESPDGIDITISTNSELSDKTIERLTSQGEVAIRFSRQTDADDVTPAGELYITPRVQLTKATIAGDRDTADSYVRIPAQLDAQTASDLKEILIAHGFPTDKSPACNSQDTPPFEYTASQCQYAELNGTPVSKEEIDDILISAAETDSLDSEPVLQVPVHSTAVAEDVEFYVQTGALPVGLEA